MLEKNTTEKYKLVMNLTFNCILSFKIGHFLVSSSIMMPPNHGCIYKINGLIKELHA
jgi:hypothetical protein